MPDVFYPISMFRAIKTGGGSFLYVRFPEPPGFPKTHPYFLRRSFFASRILA
jgi:hypothetical protein